jgi:tetratricopeptide (TPR) repeat protein
VEKLDSRYLLSLQIVDPVQDVNVAAMSREADGESGIFPVIRQLASWTRESLGEALIQIQTSEEELEKVTTPSLRALQLFSEADRLERQAGAEGEAPEEHATVAELLRAALAEDPDFASAHMLLAWALNNQGRPRDEVLAAARRAVDLSDQVSERERYIIRGSYHVLAGQIAEAIPIWEALVRRYPDDYWGNSNLPIYYIHTGRWKDATALYIKQAELRPMDFDLNHQAAWGLVFSEGDLNRARTLVRRLEQIISPEVRASRPDSAAFIEFFPFFERWMEDDVERAAAELNRLEGITLTPDRKDSADLAVWLGSAYSSLGMLWEADQIFQQLPGYPEELDQQGGGTGVTASRRLKARMLAGTAFLRNDVQTLRLVLEEQLDNSVVPEPLAVMFMVRFGLISEAKAALEILEIEGPPPDRTGQLLRTARAEIACAEENTIQHAEELRDLLNAFKMKGPAYFTGAESLAFALEQQGDLEGALRVLDAASEQRVRGYVSSGAFWLRNEWQRARVSRLLGEDDEAEKIEERLQTLLSHADPDHPILVEMKSLQKMRASRHAQTSNSSAHN